MADRRLFRFVHTVGKGGDEVTRLERKPLSMLSKDELVATANERGVKATGTKDELRERLA
jgi:hypothetical protein